MYQWQAKDREPSNLLMGVGKLIELLLMTFITPTYTTLCRDLKLRQDFIIRECGMRWGVGVCGDAVVMEDLVDGSYGWLP